MSKKIFLLLTTIFVSIATFGGGKGGGGNYNSTCFETTESITLKNFKMLGMQALNWYEITLLEDAISIYGYSVKLTSKMPAGNYCTYTATTKTFTSYDRTDLSMNAISNIKRAQDSNAQFTIDVQTGCFWDSWTNNNVFVKWTKTMKFEDALYGNEKFDMGYGQMNICPTSASVGSAAYIQHQTDVKYALTKMVKLNLLQY